MKQAAISRSAFDLLRELERNNTRDWYLEHRAEFTERIRDPFEKMLVEATQLLRKKGFPHQGSAKTMFRQNRDVRFSADKSPYKTNVSGLLTPSGGKEKADGLIYVHFSTDGGFLACGKYQLDNKALLPIRERILSQRKKFEGVISDLDSANLSFMEEGMLKSMPRGFEEAKDDPLEYYLRLKNFCVRRDLSKKAWLEGEVVREIGDLACSCRSLLSFLEG